MELFQQTDHDLAMSKLASLQELLCESKRVAVAFSGGVDSTFLLAVANGVLGENAVALSAKSAFTMTHEMQEARSFCESRDIPLRIIELDVLSNDDIRSNTPDRCYFCKKLIFTELIDQAKDIDAVLVDGTNADDVEDYRPGMKALEELDIKSPLLEVGLGKDEIRYLSKKLDLPTWDTPSSACLASRIPYDVPIEVETLARVDKSEAMLHEMGFGQCRVRVHGDLARIEIAPNEFSRMLEDGTANDVSQALKRIGFKYVTLDLLGYRMGSFNEIL